MNAEPRPDVLKRSSKRLLSGTPPFAILPRCSLKLAEVKLVTQPWLVF
jgi:hypothetical protein